MNVHTSTECYRKMFEIPANAALLIKCFPGCPRERGFRNQMLCDCGRSHRLLVLSPSPGESVQIDPRPLETAVLFRNSGYPTEIPGPLPGVLQLNVAAPNFQWCPTAPESETPLRLISSVFHS